MQKIPAKEVATDREVFGASDLDQSLKEIKEFMDYINVKDFGAKGDGVTDDTEAIQNAIENYNNIYFPKGNFLIKKGFDVSNYENRKIIANKDTTISFNASNLENESLNIYFGKNTEIKNINFDLKEYLVTLFGEENFILENNNFINIGTKQFNDLSILQSAGSKVIGFYLTGSNSIIKNNNFITYKDNDLSNWEIAPSFAIRPVTSWFKDINPSEYDNINSTNENIEFVTNIEISNNYFYGAFNWNTIELGGPGTRYNKVTNNTFLENAGIPFESDKGASYNYFSNNFVDNIKESIYEKENIKYMARSFFKAQNFINEYNHNYKAKGNTFYNNTIKNSNLEQTFGLKGSEDTLISNCNIDNTNTFCNLLENQDQNNNIINLTIENSLIKNISSINLYGSYNIIIKNCILSNFETIGFNIQNGYDYLGYLKIYDCLVEVNNSSYLFNMQENNAFEIFLKNNKFHSIQNIPFFIETYKTNKLIIDNNIFYGFSKLLGKSNNENIKVTVTNNKLNDVYILNQGINNDGTVQGTFKDNLSNLDNNLRIPGKNSITYGTNIPVNGYWNEGDIIYNLFPSAGGNIGWVCITKGNPGTWKTFGTISN